MIGQLFKTLVLIGVVVLGFLWLFQTGLLPTSWYAPLYNGIDALPFAPKSDDPALQKFEGHWMLRFAANASSSALGACSAFTTYLSAHNGAFSGHVTLPGYLVAIEASTTEAGVVSGTLSSKLSDLGAYTGSMTGGISGASGQGSWQDSSQCGGTWQLTKMGPIDDPTQARIISLSGLVTIERDNGRSYAEPQEDLYVGDILKTPEGGGATLELGLGRELVTIPENTSYTVPDAGGLSSE